MNVLITVSQNYCRYSLTMLKTLFRHNKCHITVYLMYSRVDDSTLNEMRQYIQSHGNSFEPIRIADDMFDDAPVNMHFTKEMYYRLLASKMLPESEERVLYMDPDILIRGSVEEFYQLRSEEHTSPDQRPEMSRQPAALREAGTSGEQQIYQQRRASDESEADA